VTIYRITLRDRETQTVVGYYNGAWTTDRRRALAVHRREAVEAHAARMRDRSPRALNHVSRFISRRSGGDRAIAAVWQSGHSIRANAAASYDRRGH